ncbi:MAG: NAD(P)-dependent oxidoreductase [Bifidobacterium adolescentis]
MGTGDIGSHFARLCKNVGMTTIGIRRNPAVEAPGIDHMVGFDSLDDVLQYADVIAMCVPSTPATRHLLNAERIANSQNRRHHHQRGPRRRH